MTDKDEDGFKLKPTVSPSDKEFRAKIGDETWFKIKSSAFRRDSFKCQGCGFKPFDVAPEDVLDIHLIEEDEENAEDSEVRTTCVLCHAIEHADVSVSRGYVRLVNSHFSQSELVNICRNESLPYHLGANEIRYIKKETQNYLEELKTGKALEGKVKLVFTEDFLKGLN